MDNKKFEQLIELIINENEEQAKALFHDIVVEKSREIYESMMADEMDEASGQVMDMMNEIGAEEEGMTEEEDDLEVDAMDDGDDEVVDIEADDEEGEGEEDLEDRVVDLEDKLDQLMAEFEEIMGGEEGGEEDFGDEEGGEEDFGDEDMMEAADDEEEEAVEESVMEAVQLKQVGGSSYDKFGKMGDDGANTKSVALTKPKVVQTGAKPVNVAGSPEAVPTSPKAPSNAYSKGETQVKGAGTFKNAPGSDNFKEKGESTPAPVKSQASGVNTKSPVSESKKTTKKRV